MRSGLSLDKTFLRDILRIGLPVAIQNVLTSSLSLIDSLMIGSQGELALASVGIANQWGSLLFSFCAPPLKQRIICSIFKCLLVSK